ncbi:GH3 family domain-containing protein [Robertkochia solimangrovi]|uniref:GH3 family domain-containing protein n=1 Tax=Robertkochia solimangrovi TaxID=2213046 RepID=UPI00117CF2F4|nr:GH3 auxin-responsive promoter family protein [Robertkochia solimangrovi]TRZ44312.1 GH3 auxin-responsive promoter [Robertkochia solimangrovi]
MALIGSIIKGLVEFKDAITPEESVVSSQHKVLKQLLEKASETRFGKDHDFDEILSSDDIAVAFAEKVPYFDYHRMEKAYWKSVQDGEADVTWPGVPEYFALSSGTTGNKSKRIPVTADMLDAIRGTGIKQVSALANFDMPADFFEKEIMMLGSSTNLQENNGHMEGEISGISASNIPSWFRSYYKPGEEIAGIDNWDERVKKIAEKAPEWDIGALSGIPSWMELMLKEVISTHQLEHIHQIWPNLRAYTSGGVAFEPYEQSFNKLLGKPITVIDTYLASEGFLAYQQRPETNAMRLVTDNGIYFEFVPFKPEYILEDGSLTPDAVSIGIGEVEPHKDYVLIISTVSGAWRYLIGDTIKFTNVEKAEIRITGRTKFFLNVVGSQLSVNKMNDAIKALEESVGMTISEFTLAAVKKNGEYIHRWYLGSENPETSKEVLAEKLDDFLKKANKNYKVARSKALKGVEVEVISPELFFDWNEMHKKKGGQVKMEKVMTEDKFRTWEEFVKSKAVK